MKKNVYIAIGLIIILFGILSIYSPSVQEGVIVVSGSSEEKVSPDKFEANLGVRLLGQDTTSLSEETQVIMNNIKALFGEEIIIEDESFNMYPSYSREDSPVEYSVQRSFRVSTRDIEKAGEIMNGAVRAGANQVNGYFTLSEDAKKDLRDSLIEEAVNDARAKANSLARASDSKIVGVKSVNMQQGFAYPFRASSLTMEDTSENIDPGRVQESLTVNVEFWIR